jgi:FkbM family methyltransferase
MSLRGSAYRLAATLARREGFTVPVQRGLVVHAHLSPRAALAAPLSVDLDVLGAWLSERVPEVGFVQIGAFDGATNDPLHDLVRRLGWRGVLLEPTPDAFERLNATYADVDGLVLLNAAVGAETGHRTMWHVEPQPGDPWFFSQVSSFDRAHVLGHIGAENEHRIVATEVQTLTLDDIFARSPRHVHVLQIDAEGYDAEVVRMLRRPTPTIVRFEHRHLRPNVHAGALDHLAGLGYRLAVNEDDTIAALREPPRGATAVA